MNFSTEYLLHSNPILFYWMYSWNISGLLIYEYIFNSRIYLAPKNSDLVWVQCKNIKISTHKILDPIQSSLVCRYHVTTINLGETENRAMIPWCGIYWAWVATCDKIYDPRSLPVSTRSHDFKAPLRFNHGSMRSP